MLAIRISVVKSRERVNAYTGEVEASITNNVIIL
jgi:hypothetical protein